MNDLISFSLYKVICMYEDNFDVQRNFTSSKFSANEITAIE